MDQDCYLFHDSILENIRFGNFSASRDEIIDAAKLAYAHDFIMELEDGYSTLIGNRGTRLSGGQRQRIALARALVRKPKLLILDEATSALDNLTEQTVMEEVKNIGKDLTIIMIAHRLNTVKNCDNIFLLEKGELKQQGTFNELIKNSDYFSTENN